MPRPGLPPLAVVAIVLAGFGSAPLPAATSDHFSSQMLRSAPAPGRVTPQHAYVFSEPAFLAGQLRWRYNPAGAPATLGANKGAAIQQIVDATSKWTAACGVEIIYDGETDAAPATLENGLPDRTSVIGWQAPQGGYMAATYDWTELDASGNSIIVDSDIALSPTTVTTPQLLASIITHELGHAIGLGHSPVAGALMSGPPNAAYSNITDLTQDDVQGCRCLYGPPAGVQAGFVCSLPTMIDFGSVPVGASASVARRQVDVTNDGTSAISISGVRVTGNDFKVTSNHCAPGSTLAPGATCAFELSAVPTTVDVPSAEAVVDTSVGPHRIPLRAEGLAGEPVVVVSPPSTLNVEGPWWNAPVGSESGWGLNLAHQGDVIFATWFTYDANGKAQWLSMTGSQTTANTYAGTLYRTTGPALDSVPFDGNQVQRIAAGTATLSFTDADNGTFTYVADGNAQTKRIARLVFGPVPTCTFGGQTNLALASNFQGNWWSAAESGWGVYFTHQGDNIFASWFTYDRDGTPIWLSATAAKTAAGVYSGALVRTSGPAFNAVPFDSQSVIRTTVGSMTLTFADGNNAAFAYTVAFGNPQATVTQSKQLTRLVFRAPGTVCQ